MSGGGLRSIRKSELSSITTTLAEAFSHDPYLLWLIREVSGMPSAEDFFAAQVKEAYRSRKNIEATAGFEGVAIWMAARASLTGSVGMPDHVAAVLARIDKSQPQENHYTLEWIGTRPTAFRRGYGTAAIQPLLARCDSDGVGSALWTSNPGSLDFYARHGFVIRERIEFADAPPAWWLWRDPIRRRERT